MIILINPNSTTSMTDAMVETAKNTAPNAAIVGWTSSDGPAAIQGEKDGELAVPPLLKLVQKANDAGATTIIIGCFDDTGLDEARRLSTCPVIGIGQAAYHMASLYGRRFSVVTTLAVSVPVLAQNVEGYGLSHNVARIRASGVPVLALENNREAATQQVIGEIQRATQEDDIDCIVLGCAGMVHITNDNAAGSVRLIDGVQAAVKVATMF
ncbi:aspartate/glutamate racemase family protein [Shimia sp. NS0008-38b]|uniref:aspartate/glutamate racemase family protein n=1 Tax=Shimia sp. NS0008-38b TaxID=3127653 RepID=UPI003102721A